MAVVRIKNETYTAETLYQWDKNQQLVIYGLSLPSNPEIHFTNAAMDRAIVRQATMNSLGVVSVDVPNSLLQKPHNITCYVCLYDNGTFETWYKFIVPVTARKQPDDYSITGDDGEIYSFNELENMYQKLAAQSAEHYRILTEKNKELDSELNTLNDEKSNKPTVTEGRILVSGWADAVYSFEATFPGATYDLEIALSSSATEEQATAFCEAMIVGNATTNEVKAFGTVPTVDIPIIIKAVKK